MIDNKILYLDNQRICLPRGQMISLLECYIKYSYFPASNEINVWCSASCSIFCVKTTSFRKKKAAFDLVYQLCILAKSLFLGGCNFSCLFFSCFFLQAIESCFRIACLGSNNPGCAYVTCGAWACRCIGTVMAFGWWSAVVGLFLDLAISTFRLDCLLHGMDISHRCHKSVISNR